MYTDEILQTLQQAEDAREPYMFRPSYTVAADANTWQLCHQSEPITILPKRYDIDEAAEVMNREFIAHLENLH